LVELKLTLIELLEVLLVLQHVDFQRKLCWLCG